MTRTLAFPLTYRDLMIAVGIVLLAYLLRVVVVFDRAHGDPYFDPLPAGRDQRAFQGVQVPAIVRSPDPPREVYDPAHPDANDDGYVAYPNIDLVTEMTDMLSASRAYEANITAIGVAKNMAQRALDIGRL